MKKSKLLLLTVVTALASTVLVGVAAFAKTNGSSFVKSSAEDLVPHTIELTSSHLINVDETYGYFDFKKEHATYSGYDFESYYDSYDHSFVYGGGEMTIGKNGHIFSAFYDDGGYYIDADVYFTIIFLFVNVAEYTSIVLNGEFYYNQYLTNPTTSITYEAKDIDDLTYVQQTGLYGAVLDSIVISYKCLV